MLRLETCIIFENISGKEYLTFTKVNAIEIESSWKKLTDTCKITLPRKLTIKGGDINTVIKRGSKVKVYTGYNGDLSLEFVGYVARIDAKVPYTVECEDEMWLLKQNSISKAYKNVRLKNLISDLYKGKINVVDFAFGSYRIDRASSATVLDDLQKNYNIYSYFTFNSKGEPTLNVGLGGYSFNVIAEKHTYNMLLNVVDNDLVYRRSEENKIKIVATSTNKGGAVIRVQVGDADGEEVKLDDKKNLKESDLQKLANTALQQRKFDGYKGSITGFGIPKARHNHIAVIQSPEYPERNGDYVIDGVKITFGINGYRRELELGIKI